MITDPILLSIISVAIVSLVSFVGVLTLTIRQETLKKILLYLVAFSAGALLGDVFLHMLPEIMEAGFNAGLSIYILSGIIVSFVIEKIIHWRHCHIPRSKLHPHPFAYMNLFGDAVHNFRTALDILANDLVVLSGGRPKMVSHLRRQRCAT